MSFFTKCKWYRTKKCHFSQNKSSWRENGSTPERSKMHKKRGRKPSTDPQRPTFLQTSRVMGVNTCPMVPWMAHPLMIWGPAFSFPLFNWLWKLNPKHELILVMNDYTTICGGFFFFITLQHGSLSHTMLYITKTTSQHSHGKKICHVSGLTAAAKLTRYWNKQLVLVS